MSRFAGRGLTSEAFEHSRPVCARPGARLSVLSRIWAGADRTGPRDLQNRGVTRVVPGQVSSAHGPATPQQVCPWGPGPSD